MGGLGHKRQLPLRLLISPTLHVRKMPPLDNQVDGRGLSEVSKLQNLCKKDNFKSAYRRCHLNWLTACKTVTQIEELRLAYMNL